MLALSTLSISSYVTLFTNIPKERAKFKLSRQVPSSIPFVVFDRKYKLQKFLYFFLPLVGLSQAITNGPNEVFQATNLSLLQIFLRTLLEFGDNASDDGGWTCLMLACHFSHQEIVKLMMMIENRTKYGINIQQETNDGRTALKIFNDRIEYGE